MLWFGCPFPTPGKGWIRVARRGPEWPLRYTPQLPQLPAQTVHYTTVVEQFVHGDTYTGTTGTAAYWVQVQRVVSFLVYSLDCSLFEEHRMVERVPTPPSTSPRSRMSELGGIL